MSSPFVENGVSLFIGLHEYVLNLLSIFRDDSSLYNLSSADRMVFPEREGEAIKRPDRGICWFSASCSVILTHEFVKGKNCGSKLEKSCVMSIIDKCQDMHTMLRLF
jgi:hypothetical protein